MDIMNFVGYHGFGAFGAAFGLGFIAVLIWSLFWKGLALWTAVKRHEKLWFLALLILNTMGILEIIYLFLISKEGFKRLDEINPASTKSN